MFTAMHSGMYDIMISITCTSIGFLLLLSFLTIVASRDHVRYRIKFTFFMIMSALVTTIWIPFMLRRIKDWRNALFPAWVVRKVAQTIGITFHVRGKENIVKNSGCVVLINHQSALDLCVLGELWPVLENCKVIAKKEILYLGPFGLAAWLWGTIFINRRKGEEAHDTLNATAIAIQQLKAKLLLFPEGHRHSGTSLKSFKKGAFHLAIASQTPIQPVVVSRYYFLHSKLSKFDSGSSYVTILPPIPTEGLTKADLPELMEKAYDAMNKAFVETTQESLGEHINVLRGD
ncbi:hypothetical protein KM043_015313 [Ampulex compressa]|nr:hypothetical protein KM043_015313 [Ampulex compressa]